MYQVNAGKQLGLTNAKIDGRSICDTFKAATDQQIDVLMRRLHLASVRRQIATDLMQDA